MMQNQQPAFACLLTKITMRLLALPCALQAHCASFLTAYEHVTWLQWVHSTLRKIWHQPAAWPRSVTLIQRPPEGDPPLGGLVLDERWPLCHWTHLRPLSVRWFRPVTEMELVALASMRPVRLWFSCAPPVACLAAWQALLSCVEELKFGSSSANNDDDEKRIEAIVDASIRLGAPLRLVGALSWPSVEYLQLTSVTGLGIRHRRVSTTMDHADAGLGPVLCGLPLLTRLELSDCAAHVTNACLERLPSSLTALHITYAPQLTCVDALARLHRLADLALLSTGIRDERDLVRPLPTSIRRLSLRSMLGSRHPELPRWTLGNTLAAVTAHLPGLVRLRLHLSAKQHTVAAAARVSPVPAGIIDRRAPLTSLVLVLPTLTDADVEAVLHALPENLTELELPDARLLPGRCLGVVARLPHLTRLRLRNCEALTDAAVAQLAQCRTLRALSIQCCKSLTCRALPALMLAVRLDLFLSVSKELLVGPDTTADAAPGPKADRDQADRDKDEVLAAVAQWRPSVLAVHSGLARPDHAELYLVRWAATHAIRIAFVRPIAPTVTAP